MLLAPRQPSLAPFAHDFLSKGLEVQGRGAPAPVRAGGPLFCLSHPLGRLIARSAHRKPPRLPVTPISARPSRARAVSNLASRIGRCGPASQSAAVAPLQRCEQRLFAQLFPPSSGAWRIMSAVRSGTYPPRPAPARRCSPPRSGASPGEMQEPTSSPSHRQALKERGISQRARVALR